MKNDISKNPVSGLFKFPAVLYLPTNSDAEMHSAPKFYTGARKAYICEPCGNLFSTQEDMDRHICPYTPLDLTIRDKKFKCTIGGASLEMKDHQQIQSGSTTSWGARKPYICEPCGNLFSTQEDIHRHVCPNSVLNFTNADKKFKDTISGASIDTEALQQIQSRIYSSSTSLGGDKAYRCKPCNTLFNSQEDMKRHFCPYSASNRTNAGKKFKSTTGGASLEKKDHQQDQSGPSTSRGGDKAYRCKPCNTLFNSQEDMKRHFCPYSASNRTNASKKFKSTIGGASLETKDHHQDQSVPSTSHDGGETYRCEPCDIHFLTQDVMEKHVCPYLCDSVRNNPDKNAKCNICHILSEDNVEAKKEDILYNASLEIGVQFLKLLKECA